LDIGGTGLSGLPGPLTLSLTCRWLSGQNASQPPRSRRRHPASR
jgi:hypothetical protein